MKHKFKIYNIYKITAFTLIELLLVLGIIAIIAISAFIIYPKVRTAMEINTEGGNLLGITAGVNSLYANTSTYGQPNQDITSIIIESQLSTPGADINNYSVYSYYASYKYDKQNNIFCNRENYRLNKRLNKNDSFKYISI